MNTVLIHAPMVKEAAGLLERLLDGGRRHRQEMARIRLEETRLREEYRLMNRQLDAALEVALRKLESRERAEERQFQLLVGTLAQQAKDADVLHEVMTQASLAAFSPQYPAEMSKAAQSLLPVLTAQIDRTQERGLELMRVAQQRADALESDLAELGRISRRRDG